MPSSTKQSGPIWMPQVVGFRGCAWGVAGATEAAASFMAAVVREAAFGAAAALMAAAEVREAAAAKGVAARAAADFKKVRLEWDMA